MPPACSMREAAERVVRRLQDAGHVAYFAGGCVRDMLLRREPEDYDVATSAHPDEVCRLFRRTQRVGAKFGVVLVRISGYMIETATFRADLAYRDGRHPEGIRFTNAQEDAARRDFTVNAMFFDPKRREVVDYVGGQDDLTHRLIRAVGDPRQRFAEDHLRILRAVRFAAKLGFRIDPATWEAMRELAPALSKISPERIREELESLLTHPARRTGFELLCGCGGVRFLWPGSEVLLSQAEAIANLLEALPPSTSFELAWAAMLHRLPASEVVAACKALRCSNHTRQKVSWLVAKQSDLLYPADLSLADLKLLMASPHFSELWSLFISKIAAERRDPSIPEIVRQRVDTIPKDQIAPPPWIDGTFLERLGLPKGPAYRQILDQLYYAQLNGTLADAQAAAAEAERLVRQRH